jgi:hypothetical protein
MVLITAHRRENFGQGLEDICKAVASLAAKWADCRFVYPVHLNPNVQEPAERIELDDRVQAHPPHVPGRPVAQAICHQGVAELVKGKPDDEEDPGRDQRRDEKFRVEAHAGSGTRGGTSQADTSG